MKIHRILNSITPLFIWELMSKEKDFIVPTEYLTKVPEEYRDEVWGIVFALKKKRNGLLDEIKANANHAVLNAGLSNVNFYDQDPEWKKKIGLYLNKGIGTHLKHRGSIFSFLLRRNDDLEEYIRKTIRPTANIL